MKQIFLFLLYQSEANVGQLKAFPVNHSHLENKSSRVNPNVGQFINTHNVHSNMCLPSFLFSPEHMTRWLPVPRTHAYVSRCFLCAASRVRSARTVVRTWRPCKLQRPHHVTPAPRPPSTPLPTLCASTLPLSHGPSEATTAPRDWLLV